MKHVLVLAHPRRRSFIRSMADAYVASVRDLGQTVVVRDLYAMGFNPCLGEAELPAARPGPPSADIEREVEILQSATVFAFAYPLWFYAPPAILKGYVDRVFGTGFGFDRAGGRLRGRLMISLTSSGAPGEWLAAEGALGAVRRVFDEHFAAVCGLTIADHLHFGGIEPGMPERALADCADTVSAAVRKRFGPGPDQARLDDAPERK